nr:hypothetical protein [Tanacetum cinerariifolium]
MSTSKTYQQSLADASSDTRPPMIERAHTCSSFRNTSSYYVTHPTSVVDYDDEYQQDDIQTNSEDPLTSAMLLLARAINQNLSNPTNNRLHTSSNTINQAVIQGMCMLGSKPLSVYDQQLKHGLRYSNPYTLKQVISQCPKLYLASSLGNSEIQLNIRDNEDTLDDASKSQQKVKEKMNDLITVANKQNCSIVDYQQINALYKDFVPQKELSAEQKYFPSSFIHSDKNLNATASISASMPKKHKWDSTLQNNNTKSLDYYWISKMEKLEQENVSLYFQVQSLIKERDNVKEEYQKLFDSIKKTELIAHVSEKTYAYGTIRAENQNLIFIISKFKTRLKNVEKGMNDASSVRRSMTRDSQKNHVLANSKNSAKKVAVYVRKNKQTYNTFANVISNKENVVQIVLWIIDNGCSNHMTGDRSLLGNFIKKFMGTVCFRNDNFAAITGYGDYIQGNITICHIYYVEGLGHNLFSVGQFCDGDLEVAFRSKTCYVLNLEGDDLLTGRSESNLYTISISDMAASSPVCLMGKSKKASHPPKLVSSDNFKLELLHMDLYGPMRVASIKGKKYILVIVDDYSQYTWVYFLHSKDETLEIIKKFIAQAQLNYKAKVYKIRTDNGIKFKNVTIKAHYEKLGIMQKFSTARTPQQNGVVERLATACFTQNQSIIHTRYNKTPYELLRGRKPNVEYFHVFGSLCYLTNDRDDLGKMKPKADIGVFIEPELQRFNNHNSSAKPMNTPSKEDLDNLFGLMFEEYFGKKSSDTPINSAAQPTRLHED